MGCKAKEIWISREIRRPMACSVALGGRRSGLLSSTVPACMFPVAGAAHRVEPGRRGRLIVFAAPITGVAFGGYIS